MDLILFEVPPDEILITNVDNNWYGSFFLRTHCDTDSAGKFSCLTGNCDTGVESCDGASPHAPFTSLESFAITGNFSLSYGVDLQHGFNVPIMVYPEHGPATCRPAGCAEDINRLCPVHLQVKAPGGVVIGCKSDCDASGDPKACCDGEYGGRDKCQPSASASLFKRACPSAHTWKYDGWVSSCEGASFNIILCP